MLETQLSKNSKTHYMVKVGLLSAVATIIMFMEFYVPLTPVFLKMDLSEIPVLVGTFALGPVAGIFIEMVKNLAHLPSSITGGVGELANFLIGVAFIVPAGLIYHKKKNKTGALLGLIAGTLGMTLVSVALNYYLLLPLYQKALKMPLDLIIDMGTKGNPAIVDLKGLIAFGIIPFNLVKGILVSALTLLIYKKLSPILHK